MEPTVLRHRRSPSSDRFLDAFSFSPPSTAATFSVADEFNEAELFFTTDFSSAAAAADPSRHQIHARRASLPRYSGILAALGEPSPRARPQTPPHAPLLCRRPSIPSTAAKSIPRPPQIGADLAQSAPARKILQSAPMNVPVLSRAAMRKMNGDFAAADGGEVEDAEMLPPHEIVARASYGDPKTTMSVLEGAGRTLKGRDLRQVRNAVWRQTGFLD